MNQELELEINPLPARTWNWLKMNDTVLKESVFTEPGNVTVKKPESVLVTTEQNPKLLSITTGMGKEMDRFVSAGNAGMQIFTTKAETKEEKPLRLNFSYKDGERVLNRIGLHLLPGSELTVIMDFTSAEESKGTAVVQTKIDAEEDAVLHLVQIQRLGRKFRLLDDLGINCQKKAKIDTIQLVLGGKDTYLGNYTTLEGEQSSLESDIGYLAGGDGRVDMNLVALHTGKKTNSRMDAAGVLSEKATKIFRGTIDFRKGCAGSVGNEKEEVLLLDDTIVNQTIPLIFCDEEDVEGNHGASIGKIDEELLFYLESRGIGEEEVYEMMAKAKINAICNKISEEETKSQVQEYLEGMKENEQRMECE